MDTFQDLDVWKEAHKLVLRIYKLTRNFPESELYHLTNQLRRSATSIPANIAEGKGRKTLNEYIQYLYNARGSLEETKYHLLLAKDLGYLNSGDYSELLKCYNKTGKMLNGLINSLKRKREE